MLSLSEVVVSLPVIARMPADSAPAQAWQPPPGQAVRLVHPASARITANEIFYFSRHSWMPTAAVPVSLYTGVGAEEVTPRRTLNDLIYGGAYSYSAGANRMGQMTDQLAAVLQSYVARQDDWFCVTDLTSYTSTTEQARESGFLERANIRISFYDWNFEEVPYWRACLGLHKLFLRAIGDQARMDLYDVSLSRRLIWFSSEARVVHMYVNMYNVTALLPLYRPTRLPLYDRFVLEVLSYATRGRNAEREFPSSNLNHLRNWQEPDSLQRQYFDHIMTDLSI